jgi:ribosomal protein S18 acetylase RimI-like enzyme
MEGYNNEHETMTEALVSLVETFSEIAGEEIEVEDVDGTFEIDTNTFSLTFTLTDETFEIRSIDVHENRGVGRKIVDAIHFFAEEYELEVVASNVLDTAQGFWRKMGYQAGGQDGEYFRG